jgi:hypothetical protein
MVSLWNWSSARIWDSKLSKKSGYVLYIIQGTTTRKPREWDVKAKRGFNRKA